jgi:hypothetical protein
MRGTIDRESSRLQRVAHAARAMAICLLVVMTSGVVPVAAPCLERTHRCSPQCLCKQNPAPAVRAQCPCCPPGGGRVGVIHDAGPAILPSLALSFAHPHLLDPVSAPANLDRSFMPAVPHPPPRATR